MASSSLFDGFYASMLSTFHLLYIVILGILAKKLKMVDDNFQRSLSKVVTNIILPCFIFALIVNNFRISQYQIILEAMLGCCFLFFFGLIIGYIISKLLRLKKGQTQFLAAVFSTPHTVSMPVILMQVVGPVLDTMISSKYAFLGNSEKRGLLYIVMNSIFSNIWRWSGAYYLIQPEDRFDDYFDGLNEEEKQRLLQRPSRAFKERGFKDFLKSVINTPLIASIFSLLFTASPTFQSYFTIPGSLMHESLISVNLMVAKSYGFIVMFLLGLSFADSIKLDDDSEKEDDGRMFLTACDLFWLSIMKLIVMPLLACPFILFIFRTWLEADDVMTFIYLFMASAPSAINIIVICSYKDCYVEAVSLLMIIMYAASIITLTIQVTFFIYILGTPNSSTVPPV
jgi:predicted permease